jgi:hypothetical protein
MTKTMLIRGLVLGALAIALSGCYYGPPAPAYYGYDGGYYGYGYPAYGGYYYGPSVSFGYYGGWHDHDDWDHGWHH